MNLKKLIDKLKMRIDSCIKVNKKYIQKKIKEYWNQNINVNVEWNEENWRGNSKEYLYIYNLCVSIISHIIKLSSSELQIYIF